MNQPTCTCLLIEHSKRGLLNERVTVSKCPLCAAAPALYAALDSVNVCVGAKSMCPGCKDQIQTVLAAARGEVTK